MNSKLRNITRNSTRLFDASCSKYIVPILVSNRCFRTRTLRKKAEKDNEVTKAINTVFAQHNFSPEFKSEFKRGFLEGYNSIPDPASKWTVLELARSVLQVTCAVLFGYVIYSALKDMNVVIDIGRDANSKLISDAQLPKTRFSDVRGIDEVRIELEEYVSYLKNPAKISRLGGRMPKGLLMVGPPGVGKTLLAKAMAGEAGVPFYYANASEFDDMFIGSGAKKIRKLYDEARQNTPCVVFIDEIDSIGAMRLVNSSSGTTYTSRDTIDQLLAALDGFKSNEGVLTIGATNFPDGLDKALVRPGRFDSRVTLYHPDVKGRLDIVNLYLDKVKSDPKIDRKLFARNLIGMTGADINNIVNQAAVKAAMLRKPAVTQKDLDTALDKVRMGKERTDMKISAFNLKIIASNQAGMSLVSAVLGREVHRSTILPVGELKGDTKLIPTDRTQSIPEIRNLITIYMAGRAAEELTRGSTALSVYSAESGHLREASRLARMLIMGFGYSEKVGIIRSKKQVSLELHALIDQEAERIVTECYNEAIQILKSNRSNLDLLMQTLLDRETLTGKELKEILKL